MTHPPYASALPWIPGLIHIPAGPFLMGSGDANPFAAGDEKPQHRLELPDYWISKTQITNAQFRPSAEGDGYTNQRYWTKVGWQWREQRKIVTPPFWNKPQWNGARCPVVGIAWVEAVAYCRWLSAQMDITVRLPTEAEWEKAYPYRVEDEWTDAYLERDIRRVVRGGSWSHERRQVRGAYRYYYFPRHNDILSLGLRVVSPHVRS